MKKKLLALVCALVMIFSLASCGLSTPDTVGKVGDFEVSSRLPSWPTRTRTPLTSRPF